MSKEKRLINSEIGDFYFLPSMNNDEFILQPFIHLSPLLSLLFPLLSSPACVIPAFPCSTLTHTLNLQ